MRWFFLRPESARHVVRILDGPVYKLLEKESTPGVAYLVMLSVDRWDERSVVEGTDS